MISRISGIALLVMSTVAVALVPTTANADITCYDFTGPHEAQRVLEALPHDPFGLDVGWPWSSDRYGDNVPGNGIACDTEPDIPENASPGNEAYDVNADASMNGQDQLPTNVEQVTIASAEYSTMIRTVENGPLTYEVNGVSTPEYEPASDYESDVFGAQCWGLEAQQRVQQLLQPGTTVWLEVDDAYHGGNLGLNRTSRHVWIELDGRFRLLAEVLISEGHGVVTTHRPGTGLADAYDNPPDGTRYRDALRQAQEVAIANRFGLWAAC